NQFKEIDYNFDLSNVKTDEEYIFSLKQLLFILYKKNKDDYREYIISGQANIWEMMGQSYFDLVNKQLFLNNLKVDYINNSYMMASREVKKIIQVLSESYFILTRFERTMGLDRYLSIINKKDLDLLYSIIDKIKSIANSKLEKYKDLYQTKYNLTSIYDVSKYMLLDENKNTPITSNFPSNQEKVILIVLDGFGFAQYLWSLEYYKKTKKYAYNENILNYLRKENMLIENFIASSLISDTGAGLSQIFTGLLPKETGIIASKIYRGDYKKFYPSNFIYKSPFINIKKLNSTRFDKISSNTTNMLNYFSLNNINTNVYFCSRYNKNGFSEYCFGESNVHEILPPERVFSLLLGDLKLSSKEKSIDVIYYTALDNTGHPTGAFTSFELFEHQKINSLLNNFLIELLMHKPELFNGKSTILITADHGMTDSSNKKISRDIFYSLYPKFIKNKNAIVENNRSFLFYDIDTLNIDKTVLKIKKVLTKNNIDAKVVTCNDELFKKLLYKDNNLLSKNLPDIVVLIEGDGIIFSKNINENLYHYGGHGGRSIEEVFVPLLGINLSEDLKQKLENKFFKLT
ncbi:MAG: alkaline phosphatase family protein, partial [bacterium]